MLTCVICIDVESQAHDLSSRRTDLIDITTVRPIYETGHAASYNVEQCKDVAFGPEVATRFEKRYGHTNVMEEAIVGDGQSHHGVQRSLRDYNDD